MIILNKIRIAFLYKITIIIVVKGNRAKLKEFIETETLMKNTRGYFETLAAMLSNGYRVDSALMGRDREEAFYNRFAR